ncbi:MAG: hypothetical protein PHD51_03545 [Patescibacteria group bacterium]|nr:hypothetical protein [Patescibacteria group bacterium]MDD5490951.1 hypothetical protein [Patescibacteria group bacterium]
MKSLLTTNRPHLYTTFKKGVIDGSLSRSEFDAKYPDSWDSLMMLWNLYQAVAEVSDGEGEMEIVDWLVSTFGCKIPEDSVYREFTEAIKAAKGFRAGLIREFVSAIYRFRFTSDGVAKPTDDPLKLLKIMWEPEGDERYSEVRSFDAGLFWHLGMRYLLMRVMNDNRVGEQLRETTLTLEERLFDGKAERKMAADSLLVRCDPKNNYRFDLKGSRRVIIPLEFRYIKAGKKVYKVLYENRVKTENDVFRKSLTNNAADNPRARDSCAISLIFFSEEDLRAVWEERLCKDIFSNPDAVSNVVIRGKRKPEEKNHHTSREFFPEMKFISFFCGGILEVQLHLFPKYFNHKYSMGEENHHLYRLRQIQSLLRAAFPSEFYIDWDDKKIQNSLIAKQKGAISANFI